MADISIVARLVSGIQRNVDLASNTLVVNVVKVGGGAGTDLTKAILDNLITLQNGSDIAASVHHHDGRYFTEAELGSALAASGSDLIGDDNTYSNFTPAAATVKGALAGIDSALATAGGTEFADDVFAIQDNADATKQIIFQASGIATATSRTITMPDTDVDLGDIATNTSAIALRALDADVIKKDGSVAFTGDQSMGSFKLTNLAAPVSDNDAARKVDVDAASAGMLPKAPVDLATTGNITLSGEQTIDGTLTSASRVLVQAQSDLTENGIYVTAAGAWSRAADADGSPSSEIQGGNSVFVNGGTDNANTIFRLTGSGNITPDVGDQDWIIYSRAEAVSASTGLTKVGLDVRIADAAAANGIAVSSGAISVQVDDSSIEISGNNIAVKALGITNAMLAGSIADAKLAADYVQTSEVDDSSIEWSGTALQVKALGITNAMLAGSIATAKLVDAATVTEAKSFFDATDISGAEAETLTDGSNADSLHKHAALVESVVVGETMPASGPVAVRMGIVPVAGETEGRVYKADPTELSVGGVDPFHVIGIGIAASQAVAGTMDIVKQGTLTATAHGFAIGLPIFLDSAGALTGTAPSASGEAVVKVGIAVDTNTIEVQIQIMGVN